MKMMMVMVMVGQHNWPALSTPLASSTSHHHWSAPLPGNIGQDPWQHVTNTSVMTMLMMLMMMMIMATMTIMIMMLIMIIIMMMMMMLMGMMVIGMCVCACVCMRANWTAPLGSTTASTTGQHHYYQWTAPLATTTGQPHRCKILGWVYDTDGNPENTEMLYNTTKHPTQYFTPVLLSRLLNNLANIERGAHTLIGTHKMHRHTYTPTHPHTHNTTNIHTTRTTHTTHRANTEHTQSTHRHTDTHKHINTQTHTHTHTDTDRHTQTHTHWPEHLCTDQNICALM
jgi:hypothetical protein